jgi:hypothetical protein
VIHVRYARAIVDASESIERQFTFARDYQSLGVRAPEWQCARQVFERARALGLAEGLDVSDELEGLELLADPLLDRVFSVLLDNTRRHGEKATRIRTWYEAMDDALVIIYEDTASAFPSRTRSASSTGGTAGAAGWGCTLPVRSWTWTAPPSGRRARRGRERGSRSSIHPVGGDDGRAAIREIDVRDRPRACPWLELGFRASPAERNPGSRRPRP